MEITGRIKLLKSKEADVNGVALAPLASELEFGQIAVNYSALNPCLFFKDKDGKVIKIVSEGVIADTLVEILGGAAADLSTLKELLDKFGSSDIATTQADILKRLSAVETGKVDKVTGKGLSTNDYTDADKAHMTNTANPHGVTYQQVGALAVDGTAINSSKFDNKTPDQYFRFIDRTPNTYNAFIPNTTWRTSATAAHHDLDGDLAGYTFEGTVANFGQPERAGIMSFQLAVPTSTNHGLYYASWYGTPESRRTFTRVWDAKNSNLSTADWSAASLHAFTSNPALTVYDTNKSKKSYFGWVGVHGTYMSNVKSSTVIGIKDDGTPHYTGYVLYHAGNSNLPNAPWTASTMNATDYRGSGVSGELTRFIASHGKGVNQNGGGLQFYSGQATGTGTCGDIKFITGNNSTTAGEALAGTSVKVTIMNTTGFVGLGTETPREMLDVRGAVVASTFSGTKTAGGGTYLIGVDGSGTDKLGGNLFIQGSRGTGNTAGGYIAFQVAPLGTTSGDTLNPRIDAMRILNNGNVGIGTSTPTERLDVNGNIKTNGGSIVLNAPNTTGGWFRGSEFRGTDNTLIGGIGVLGNGATIGRMCLGLGITPWDNPTISMLPNKFVGIDKATPTEKLDVNGNGLFSGNLTAVHGVFTGNINATYASIGRVDGGNNFARVFSGDKYVSLWAGGSVGLITDNTDIVFNDGLYNTKFLFDMKNKRLGIGTQTPSQALDVFGNITLGTTTTGTTEKPHWAKLDFKGYYGIYGRIQSRDRSVNNGDGLMQFLVRADSGAATNVEPQLVLSLNSDKSAEFQGNGLFNGNVTAKGDVVAYSATSNVRIEPLAGASNLFDLGDVELPADLTSANNHVLAYNTTKKKWTAVESAGTGGAPVDYARLSNVPTSFAPCPHNHEDATYVSDVRLKQNIESLNNALSTVLALEAKSFGWTTEAKERYRMKDEMSYGYIAQDVEKVVPAIVKELETGDGFIGVEYIKIIPFITEAIKELHDIDTTTNLNMKKHNKTVNRALSDNRNETEDLKKRIAELENRLAELESKK